MSKMKKPKTLRPPMPIVTPVSTNQENERQFELELCWCVQQLENALSSGKLSQKVADDTAKNLKILKGNTNTPLIKKRQVMKASMGDYRAKMKEEEKKMALVTKQIKFTPSSSDIGKKSSFVKKSAILSSGKDFRFNFKPCTEEKETNGNAIPTDNDANKRQVPSSSERDNIPTNSNPYNINLTSGSGFTFNFAIDEVNDEINFDDLTIKN